MRVAVIGAGLIGCATAYQLARNGFEVDLLDSAADVGTGASFANGAQLSYSYVEPLASPSTLRSLPKLLLEPDSPLKLRLQLDRRQWSWLLAFVRACTTKQATRGTQELLVLAGLSRLTLESWMEEEKEWSFGFERNGKLVLCQTIDSLQKQARQVQLQEKWGCQQRLLDRDACVAAERSLANSEVDFVGGVWTETECVADPYQLCQALASSAAIRGARIHLNSPVESWMSIAGRVVGVKTRHHIIDADCFVICAGTSSVQLAHKLALSLPIYPVKGYSLTLPIKNPAGAPACSITDLGRKAVYAPLNGHLRVAAAAELVGHGLEVDQRRTRQMCASVEKMFPGAMDLVDPKAWVGLRPATPNSLPLIGPTSVPGVWLNTGHGALGLTLAAGSAKRLVDLLDTTGVFR